DTYEQAWDAGYRGLTPANQYNIDYSVLGTGRRARRPQACVRCVRRPRGRRRVPVGGADVVRS
ncbi:hypothetical protein ACWDUG_26765, partial [Streptomyces cellulosae]